MRIDLKDGWQVRWESLECGPADARSIQVKKEDWLPAPVPGDVRQPLLAAGLIREPLEGLNCFDSEWVEQKSWWFRKSFACEEAMLTDDIVELVLESLDYGADIFLNGNHLGLQLSSFYPFRRDVRPLLRAGENVLLVRLTTGLERVNPEDMRAYAMSSEEERRPGRGDKRKGFPRKPQYSFGWDWNPRVATCGIMKPVWLEAHRQAAIRRVHVATARLEPAAVLQVEIEVENFHPYATRDAGLCLIVSLAGQTVATLEWEALLRSGLNYLPVEMTIPEPQLWWPNGMGSQPLYQASLTMCVEGVETEWPAFSFGIRTIELDQTRDKARERRFSFRINGRPVFCKGGNWIPADSLYGRVSDERYAALVAEARAANFNMLRIWGGGLYERDIFYDLCDRAGIMLWHDFMFACSEYPDNQDWFRQEAERELQHQTRHLANHPALVLWCGNNENHWGFASWWPQSGHFGAHIYNFLAPAAVRQNCPEIPYWNSSPYGGPEPNSPLVGDRHHWHDCMMNPEMMKRIVPEEYDRANARFISEYGYVGPVKRESVERFFGGAPVDIHSAIWQHHTNTFEKDTVAAGIRYHYTDPENLDLDRYLLYAGLCQGLMYQYSLEAFRYRASCSGGLFWMYNDCWGETGWTIIDHELRRKIAWYFVKRALAPVKVILRANEGGQVQAVGINENAVALAVPVEYGTVSRDGRTRVSQTTVLQLAPRSRQLVLVWTPAAAAGNEQAIVFVRPLQDGQMPTVILRRGTWRQMGLPAAPVTVYGLETRGDDLILDLGSAAFAHAVHFDLPADIRLSDDYFDLLPGERHRVTILGGASLERQSIRPVATGI